MTLTAAVLLSVHFGFIGGDVASQDGAEAQRLQVQLTP